MKRLSAPSHRSRVATGALAMALLTLAGCELLYLDLTNEARANAGRAPLSASLPYGQGHRIRDLAVAHSRQMCADRAISHVDARYGTTLAGYYNPAGPWRKMAENVGVSSGSEQSLFNAFMSSSAHRANILNPAFQYQVVGEHECEDGRRYVTHFFLGY